METLPWRWFSGISGRAGAPEPVHREPLAYQLYRQRRPGGHGHRRGHQPRGKHGI